MYMVPTKFLGVHSLLLLFLIPSYVTESYVIKIELFSKASNFSNIMTKSKFEFS